MAPAEILSSEKRPNFDDREFAAQIYITRCILKKVGIGY
jgi:hypothetical protein